MTINDYIGAPEDRRAVVYSGLHADTTLGSEYFQTYVWFLDFNEDGNKIVKIMEFMDTRALEDIRSKMAAAGVTAIDHE